MKKILYFISSFMLCGLVLFGCAPSEYKEIANEANEIFEDDCNNNKSELEAKAKSEGIVVTFTYKNHKNKESYLEEVEDTLTGDAFSNEVILMRVYQIIYTQLGYEDKLIVEIETKNGDLLYQFEYDSYDSFREEKVDNVH